MANIINNTDLDKIQNTIENGQSDRQFLRKPVKLQGEWNLDPKNGYQFKTELTYEKGKQTIEIDSPSFLGGNGNRVGPMGYCIAGITSCFIATVVSIASSRGIIFNKLNVNAECNINFAKTFDIADEPITESINFYIYAKSEEDTMMVDKQKLQELVRMAEERCPAIYSMSHVIKINAEVK
ncbi:MAG TPA: OsmC family protein [Candidatus Nitrosocosmicus sp.]|nr:OsmC family protein [Candidatus Nitrosocosmicus sp.]